MKIDRRELLKASLAVGGGALVLSALWSARESRAAGTQANVTAWIRIAPDNTITVIASQSEMGQGTSTTLAAILADELYLPPERVRIEFAPFDPAYRDPVYNWMFTGNSQGISSFYDVMRTMGAAARTMLLAAAAKRLGTRTEQLSCSDGVIRGQGHSVTFGDVAAEAAKLDVPKSPPRRPDSSLDGKSVPRWDIPSKVDGSAIFGIDVKVPGMLLATVRCSPRFGGRLAKYDGAKLRSAPGVVAVVEVPNGIAVVAKTYWQARSALASVSLEWSGGSVLTSNSKLAPAYAEGLAKGPFFSYKNDGAATEAMRTATVSREAVYQIPFQAHATMEPMNCTAHVTADKCEIWAPTQGVEMAQGIVARLTGLPSDRIVIHRTLLGGGFGRRLIADFIQQAVIVSKAVGKPVKLIWSREEDMTHDFYRPAMLHAIRGGLDADGKLIALAHRVVSPSHMLYIFPRAMFPDLKDWSQPAAPPEKMDAMAVEGLLDSPYAIANQSIEQHRLELDVPVSVWRTTGHGPNNFVLESFVDEMAIAAKADPIAFRRRLLPKDSRALKVLDVLAEKAEWSRAPKPGVGRGVALASAFGGYVASVVELRVQEEKVKLQRIVTVVDCGRTLDPGIAESNILGGIVWGISGMKTAATFANGAAERTNFSTFQPAFLWETPPCEVHFIESGAKLGGTGELGPVPLHAAICNAICSITGRRIRSLPISDSGLSFA